MRIEWCYSNIWRGPESYGISRDNKGSYKKIPRFLVKYSDKKIKSKQKKQKTPTGYASGPDCWVNWFPKRTGVKEEVGYKILPFMGASIDSHLPISVYHGKEGILKLCNSSGLSSLVVGQKGEGGGEERRSWFSPSRWHSESWGCWLEKGLLGQQRPRRILGI